MKLVLDSVPYFNKEELEKNNLKVLTTIKSNRYSIIIGSIMVLLACICSFEFGRQLYYLSGSTISNLLIFLVMLVIMNFIMIVPHELSHMIYYPKTFNKDELVIGFSKANHSFYCYQKNPQKQFKVLLSLLTPLILFTVIPYCIICIKGFNLIIFAVIVANLIMSANDIYNFIVIFFKAPLNSKIRIFGDKIFTYEADKLIISKD